MWGPITETDEPVPVAALWRTVDHSLGRTDQRLLELLIQDGRTSITDLAQEVGLSTSATAVRVRRLQDTGVITGFHASVDPSALGRAVCATVRVSMGATSRRTGFEQWLAGQFDVVELFHCTGHFDYELRLACRDPDTLYAVVDAIRNAGAADTETTLLQPVKTSAVPSPDQSLHQLAFAATPRSSRSRRNPGSSGAS